MYTIKNGFVNHHGISYPNIRDIHFDKQSDMMGNLGTYISETEKEDNFFFTSSFKRENGVYIYQSKYDDRKALRIYRDFADYRYTYHDDDFVVSELQKRQPLVKLTEFPTGIISIEDKVIGQEMFYYKDYLTIAKAITENKVEDVPTLLYLKIITILQELISAGVIYSDIHTKNFMIDLNSSIIKLVDFEKLFISFDSEDKSLYRSMLNNLKNMLNQINLFYGLSFDICFEKTENLEQIKGEVEELHYSLSKK